jgi:hypothetical protein
MLLLGSDSPICFVVEDNNDETAEQWATRVQAPVYRDTDWQTDWQESQVTKRMVAVARWK